MLDSSLNSNIWNLGLSHKDVLPPAPHHVLPPTFNGPAASRHHSFSPILISSSWLDLSTIAFTTRFLQPSQSLESVFKDSLKKLKRTEVEMINDGHHSSKAVVLAHAVSRGRFSDADYLKTTFPVMVECLFCPGTSPQPIIFCLAGTLAEIKGACMIAFAQDENFPVVVEVIWANTGLRMAVRPLKMSERNVKAMLRMLKARAGVDVLRVHSEKSYSDMKDSDEA